MNESFLRKLMEAKAERIESAKRDVGLGQIRDMALAASSGRESYCLFKALSNSDGTNIIAEFKRASPSKGVINDGRDVVKTAKQYEVGGACAMSVLTEEDFFQGSLDDLREVRSAVDIPVLRKDFTIDKYQVYEAASAGADAVLLIVTALAPEELQRFHAAAHKLGLDAVVEVHNPSELEIARSIGATIIGVNNRNLKTFEVSLDVSRELIKHKPDGCLMISESGITSIDEIQELKALGFDGFLIGETLMRSGDPTAELKKLAAN